MKEKGGLGELHWEGLSTNCALVRCLLDGREMIKPESKVDVASRRKGAPNYEHSMQISGSSDLRHSSYSGGACDFSSKGLEC